MQKLIYYLLLIFLFNQRAMGQNIEFSSKGLTILQLGTKKIDNKSIVFDKIENYTKNSPGHEYQGDYLSDYTYYFIKADSMYIEKGGLINNIFFAEDKTGVIRGIFLELEHITDSLPEVINTAFGKARLASNSSIENRATNNKLLWAKDEVRLLLTRYHDKEISKISICNTIIDERTPYVLNRKVYEKRFNN